MSLAKKSLITLLIIAIAIAASIAVSRNLHRGISGMGEEFAQKLGYQIGLAPKPSWVGEYLSGYHATSAKDYEKASDYFSESLKLSSTSEMLQTQAMSLLLVSGKFSEAVAIAKTIHSKSNNGLARLTLIVDAIQNNKLDDAERLTLEEKTDASTIINHVIEAWIKYGKGQHQEAETMLKTLSRDEVFRPFVDYNYALIANLSGDKATARQLYDSLVQSAQLPNSIVSSAYAFYKDAGDNEKLAVIKTKFNYDGAVSKHPAVTNVKQGVAEALLGVGGIILTEYSPDKSAALFRLALYLNPQLDDAKLLLGSILMTEGDYAGANDILSGIKQDSYLGDYAKLAIAKNFEAMDKTDKAIEYFQNLTTNKDTKIDAYVSLGDLSRKKENYKEAADYYTKAIDAAAIEGKDAKKDGKIGNKYWALYFARGVCYERLKEMDKSEADLQAALQMEPNQPDVLNYLGYSWIDIGKNLAKAKDMVMKAHEEKPDDPQITDSLGWAYFKLGDFNNSVAKLEEAATLLPYDPTVNDHLGDAYWQTGRKNEAKYQWERALKNDPEPDMVEGLKKKLENGIPPENVATQTSNAG